MLMTTESNKSYINKMYKLKKVKCNMNTYSTTNDLIIIVTLFCSGLWPLCIVICK